MATQAQRQAMLHTMDFLVQHRNRVHYAEVRPMRTHWIKTFNELRVAVAKPGGITMDCSESVTLICRLAGLKDPNGLNYNGTGFTGTLLSNLLQYRHAKAAMTGALVVFGPGTGTHVAMVHTPDPVHGDPLLWTHGEESDPSLHPLSWMEPGFKPPVTFLSIANL